MLRFLANRSVQAKVVAVPAGLVLMLLALGCYAYVLLSSNEAGVRRLNEAVTDPAVNMLEFSDHARASLADLYRLTSIAANENDDAKLTKMSKDEIAQLDAFGKSFAPLKPSMLGAGIADSQVAAFEASLAAYVKQAKFVADMAESDAASALTFMTGTQTKFAAMDKDLTAMTTYLGNARRDGLAAINRDMSRGKTVFVAVILAMAAVALTIAILVGRLISRPIVDMTSALGRLADKDYGVEIPALDQVNEIGRMAKAIEILKERSQAADKLDEERRAEEAAKLARSSAIATLTRDFGSDVDTVVSDLAQSATKMQSDARSMSTTAEETNRQAVAVAAASEEASTNVQTVASAAEELSASIAEIGRSVSEAARVAGKAVEDATRTNASIEGLAEAAQKIGDVVKLINDIAGQTNLLALNATIEAARAGEAGKGFAVVASEVKNLATQTASATGDIAAQIGAIQSASGAAVQAIKEISGTIRQISEIATTIASAVEEQGAATKEIARNVQQASAGTSDVSSNIAGVTHSAGETGQVAGHVLIAAQSVTDQVQQLKGRVDSFLTKIRAA